MSPLHIRFVQGPLGLYLIAMALGPGLQSKAQGFRAGFIAAQRDYSVIEAAISLVFSLYTRCFYTYRLDWEVSLVRTRGCLGPPMLHSSHSVLNARNSD
jgi:hypothetical protein